MRARSTAHGGGGCTLANGRPVPGSAVCGILRSVRACERRAFCPGKCRGRSPALPSGLTRGASRARSPSMTGMPPSQHCIARAGRAHAGASASPQPVPRRVCRLRLLLRPDDKLPRRGGAVTRRSRLQRRPCRLGEDRTADHDQHLRILTRRHLLGSFAPPSLRWPVARRCRRRRSFAASSRKGVAGRWIGTPCWVHRAQRRHLISDRSPGRDDPPANRAGTPLAVPERV